MFCLTSSRFTQEATLLHQGEETPEGHWEDRQDPDSGAIIRVWVTDDPNIDNEYGTETFSCMARGFVSGGVNGNGAVESWSNNGEYTNMNVLRLNFPASVQLSQRDRVTNITDRRGNAVYVEDDGVTPTIYDVQAVTPVLDAFGMLIEKTALLSRSENQA